MNKFTPGPWKIIDDGEDNIVITDVEQQVGVCELRLVASGSKGERDANALLISAAPELLVALEEMVRETNYLANGPESKIGFPFVIARAYLAIMKAKGEKI